jgi:hypothetical protein
MSGGALTRSALNRFGRSAIQAVLAFVTVEAATDWVSDQDLSADEKVMAVLAVKVVLAFLHRRFVDPSPLPALVDGAAGEVYEGRRVKGDGIGPT